MLRRNSTLNLSKTYLLMQIIAVVLLTVNHSLIPNAQNKFLKLHELNWFIKIHYDWKGTTLHQSAVYLKEFFSYFEKELNALTHFYKCCLLFSLAAAPSFSQSALGPLGVITLDGVSMLTPFPVFSHHSEQQSWDPRSLSIHECNFRMLDLKVNDSVLSVHWFCV